MVVRLQARVRCWQVKKQLGCARLAACLVQAAWRGHAWRRTLQRQQAAALRLQAAWRGSMERARFLQARAAAVTLQAAVRGMQQREKLHAATAAAVNIQVRLACHLGALHWTSIVWNVLQHLNQNAWLRLVSRWACWLQAAVRQILQTRAARRMQAAAVLQRHVRGHLQRRQLARWHAAATAMQSCWRGAVQHRRFQQHMQAALVVQAAWRRRLARVALMQQQAAVVLQRWAASRMNCPLCSPRQLLNSSVSRRNVSLGQDGCRNKLR